MDNQIIDSTQNKNKYLQFYKQLENKTNQTIYESHCRYVKTLNYIIFITKQFMQFARMQQLLFSYQLTSIEFQKKVYYSFLFTENPIKKRWSIRQLKLDTTKTRFNKKIFSTKKKCLFKQKIILIIIFCNYNYNYFLFKNNLPQKTNQNNYPNLQICVIYFHVQQDTQKECKDKKLGQRHFNIYHIKTTIILQIYSQQQVSRENLSQNINDSQFIHKITPLFQKIFLKNVTRTIITKQ
eukprot:TRINITY_DN10778_c0_g1_i4.p1 TRINITY_DN10778_c0_g1~~TRINITY_DN10778_c0_g1_i4.p1  ORF type:complete len:238 (-),score=-21.68 TRINITY_DN10778_c0_g1_i4:164-877(-)